MNPWQYIQMNEASSDELEEAPEENLPAEKSDNLFQLSH